MPPKKGSKRKATTNTSNTNGTNGDAPPLPPDRATWPGWVEMESEPAFFNVMLKEMGARGVKVQEVYSLDDEMLAFLPQPVHALIFLFRYRDVDEVQQMKGTVCPKHIWFANQVPDFACASVALLNIVNNIQGLGMGKELRNFRDFTQDMNPLSRGDAIDSFDFARKIHNSFARENDLLNAELHIQQKAAKAKKRRAAAKGRATREAQQTKTPLKEKSSNVKATPTRTSGRSAKKDDPVKKDISRESSVLSDPPESDPEYETPTKAKGAEKKTAAPQRRSQRKPKPRKDTFAASATAAAEIQAEEGFHFIAYMPIQGHVWKLDGLDSFPHDIGEYDADGSGDWMSIAQPALQTRMAMYEGADIEFNLMAVVHDPAENDRLGLLRNIKQLQQLDKKLDGIFEDWRELDGAETKKGVLTGFSTDFAISQADINATALHAAWADEFEDENDLLKVVEMRRKVTCHQGHLRAAIKDALETSRTDDEKAAHRRYDYASFAKLWISALASNEALDDLLSGE